jgi:serine/threonine-protein kinase
MLPAGQSSGRKREFGRYQLLYRFASGGMAQIYLGRLSGAEGFEKLVALKIIHQHLTEQEEFVKMFIDEARLASRIAHPNVVQILELGKVFNTHYIAMEYVEGESVSALIRKTLPPFRISARVIADAAAGLHAAHELRDKQGELLHVVHRDISPPNILISYRGATKVVDFGVARAKGSLHTTRGEVKGKMAYMAPEQLRAPEKVDRRSDVFALGIVLFEMTTRRRLFKGDTDATQISKVLYGEIVPPSRIVEGYPEELEAIVLRALEREQEKRFQTARELQMALERYISATGDPVLQSEVGELMTERFADRIAKKQQQITAADSEECSNVQDVELISGQSLELSIARDRGVPRRRALPLALAAGLVVAALGLGLAIWWQGSGDAQPARVAAGPASRPTAAPDTLRSITIAVTTRPAGAKISLDGEAMKNPLELTRPAHKGQAELVVEAPGFKTERFKVQLDRGGRWMIALQPAPVAVEKPAVKRRPHRRPKKVTRKVTKKVTKKAKKDEGDIGDSDVLVSPYGKHGKQK